MDYIENTCTTPFFEPRESQAGTTRAACRHRTRLLRPRAVDPPRCAANEWSICSPTQISHSMSISKANWERIFACHFARWRHVLLRGLTYAATIPDRILPAAAKAARAADARYAACLRGQTHFRRNRLKSYPAKATVDLRDGYAVSSEARVLLALGKPL